MNLAYCLFLNFNKIQIKSCQKKKLNDKCITQDIVKKCFMANLKRKT